MKDYSIIIPKYGDFLMFADCELKIRNPPNMIINANGKTPGYVFSFLFSVDNILSDYPEFENKFQLGGDLHFPRKLYNVSDSTLASGIDGYLVINEYVANTGVFKIATESFDVFGKVSLVYTNEDIVSVMFSAGLLDLPSLEKAPNLNFQRISTPPPKQKLSLKKETYTKFEILDIE